MYLIFNSPYLTWYHQNNITNCSICLRRWAQFRQISDQIEANAKRLADGDAVNYREHIGGGYYVSITSGFLCIDVRRFCVPNGQTDVKPTRLGLAFRLPEWSAMKEIMEKIDATYTTLATAVPCILTESHMNQLGMINCHECNPFDIM